MEALLECFIPTSLKCMVDQELPLPRAYYTQTFLYIFAVCYVKCEDGGSVLVFHTPLCNMFNVVFSFYRHKVQRGGY